MRRLRLILWVGLVGILVLVGYFTLRGLGLVGAAPLMRAHDLPPGDQEIAWIHTATNAASWERLVAAVRRVEQSWPGLRVDYGQAFPEHTAAVPELALALEDCPHRLWIRWYKLTSEAGAAEWVAELARRQPPPLALIGGGSSDRARDLARALRDQQDWQGEPPLLLLTTATADNVHLLEGNRFELVPLTNIHAGRTFRFCFTNSQMAEAVQDFVWSKPYLRPYHPAPTLLIGTAPAAALDGFGACLFQLTTGAYAQPPQVHLLEWQDDPYSLDLSAQFRAALLRSQPAYVTSFGIPYSVGGYARPNPQEAHWIEMLTKAKAYSPDQRELLVLPTVDRPARRILRGLTAALPMETRNLVAVTGDSITFNSIYRDRNLAWNIQDLPVTLVLFSHQNPVQWESREVEDAELAAGHASATDDLLLNADIVRLILEGAFDRAPSCRLLASSQALAERLRSRQPAFFRPDGNRVGGSGEYVVCLRPHIEADRVLPRGTIEVWTRMGEEWQQVRSFQVVYAPL